MLIKVFSLFLFLPDYLLLDRVAIQGYPWYKHLEYSQPLPLPELVHIEDMKTPVKSIDYIKRANQYQKYIFIINVSLIIASTFSICSGAYLMRFYQSNKLGFWPSHFELIPYYMVVFGMSTLISGIFGIVATQLQNKLAWIVFAVLMTLNILPQLGSIFMGLEARSSIGGTKNCLMVVYACIGGILATIELISVVLVCAMIHSLNRQYTSAQVCTPAIKECVHRRKSSTISALSGQMS